ncbi:MAG: nucleoside monophosphate kinase [Bryobacterales bacterium]|jgi:adenylate kinase|nr:nucleoside monophosphate kinase [Bryobacterales bacterium]
MASSDTDQTPTAHGTFSLTPKELESGTSPASLVLLFGPPGSGKGTQAGLLSRRLNLPHVSTGDILRDRILQGDALGKAIARQIDVGQFVPDEWINQLLDERLRLPDCRGGVILDGYPRTQSQAERVLDTAQVQGARVLMVLLLASARDLAERFVGRRQCSRCGALFHLDFQPSLAGNQCDRPFCSGDLVPRLDDREEFLAGRLADYQRLTAPAVELLTQRADLVVHVAASAGSPEHIHQEIWKALAAGGPLARESWSPAAQLDLR